MIFVTGGTGLVGIRLLVDLLAEGREVIALKREKSNTEIVKQCFSFYGQKDLYSKIKWIDGDILDSESYMDYLDSQTFVYHCAAVVSFKPSDNSRIYQNNVLGTQQLVNACLKKKVKKLGFVSSVAALGGLEAENTPITEDSNFNEYKGRNMYAISKFEAEMEVWRGIAEGLSAVIVNPTIILGVGDKTKTSNRLFYRILKGLNFYTKGIFGFVDVQDVSRCIIHLMESDIQGERFILNSENLSFENVFSLMANELKVPPPSFEVKPWISGLIWRLDWLKSLLFRPRKFTRNMAQSLHEKKYYSSEKIKNRLDIPFIPIEESVKKYGKYYR